MIELAAKRPPRAANSGGVATGAAGDGVEGMSATATRKAPPHPRHDPAFVDRCLNDLIWHVGEWRHLGQRYAAHVESGERCQVVRDAVEIGKRIGLLIEGDARLGYRCTGFKRRRYVRSGEVVRIRIPRSKLPDSPLLAGQMALFAEAGQG